MSVQGFGNAPTVEARSATVTMPTTTLNPIDMRVNVVDSICTLDEVKQTGEEMCPNFDSLDIVDSYPRGSAKVDLLIGADYIWSLVDWSHRVTDTKD